MGNRASKKMAQATARAVESQQVVQQSSKPSLYASHLRITDVETAHKDESVVYTFKEDFDVIQQMKQMDDAQRKQFVAQLNEDSKQQDDLLRQAEAAAQYQQEQQARQYSSLTDDKFLKQFLQQQEATQQEQRKQDDEAAAAQKAAAANDDAGGDWSTDFKNDSYVNMIQKLSTNIVSTPVTSNVGTMPEYMKCNLAKAKPKLPSREKLQRPQDIDDPNNNNAMGAVLNEKDNNNLNNIENNGAERREPTPPPQLTLSEQLEIQHKLPKYNPHDIPGTLTAKDLIAFCNQTREMQFKAQHGDEQSHKLYTSEIEKFAERRGMDPAVVKQIVAKVNSAFVYRADKVSNGLWYSPFYQQYQ